MNLATASRVGAAALLALAAVTANAANAIHDANLFTTVLPANDDGSTSAPIDLGFSALINGTTYSNAYVNNNGNITFGQALSTYTPAQILGSPFPIIAAFWADIDTRGTNSGLTQYGGATLDGKNVFGINWIGVGYYASRVDKLNSLQMILTDRSDVGAGDFDIQFNYDQIQWETGEASGGVNGLGGTSAAVGYAVGTNLAYQLPGSFVNGALLDGGPNALVAHSLNSNTLGQYNFQVRNGEVVPSIPEPETYALMALGLGVVGWMARRRKQG